MAITAAELMVRVGGDTGQAEGALNRVDSKLKGVAKGAGKTGALLSAGITAPLVGGFMMAINSAGGFEQTMNVIRAVTGATEADIASLTSTALGLGKTTSFSAGEAAEGLLELTKAGMSAEEAGQAIAGTLDLAAAGELSVASAAEISANALNTFSLAADESMMVSDLLAAAANASSAEVSDLAYGYQMAGAVFAANNQSVNDLSTALAIMANNGISGSDAGTSLKTMMMRLTAPTDKAAGVMKELGINVWDAQGNMLPFGDVITSLEQAMGGLTQEQQANALATVFGADAVRAANIMIKEGADGWNEMSEAVNQSGAAADVAGARLDGLKGAIAYFKGSLDSFLIGKGSPFLGFLADMIRGAADAVTSLANLPAPLQRIIMVLLGLAAAAGPVLLGISAIAGGLSVLLSPVGLVVAAVAGLVAIFATDFLGIRTAVMNVIVPLATTLLSFGRYIRHVVQDGDTLNDWLTHLPKSWQQFALATGKAIASIGPRFRQFLGMVDAARHGNWEPLKTGFLSALRGIRSAIETFSKNAFTALKTGLESMFRSIALPDWLDRLLSWAWPKVDAVVDWVRDLLVWKWPEIVATAVGWVSKLMKWVWPQIGEAADWVYRLLKWVWPKIGDAVDWVSRLMKWVWPKIAGKAAEWVSKLMDWKWPTLTQPPWVKKLLAYTAPENNSANTLSIKGLTDLSGLSAKLSGVGNKAIAALEPFVAWANDTLSPAAERLESSFSGMLEGLGDLGPDVDEMVKAFGGLVEALEPLGQSIKTTGGLMLALWGGVSVIVASIVTNTLAAAFDALPGVVSAVIDLVADEINSIKSIITDASAAVQAVIDGDFKAAFDAITSVVETVLTSIGGKFDAFNAIVLVLGDGIATAFTNTLNDLGVDEVIEGIKTKISEFKDWVTNNPVVAAITDAADAVNDAITAFQNFTDPNNTSDGLRSMIPEFRWDNWVTSAVDFTGIQDLVDAFAWTTWVLSSVSFESIQALVDAFNWTTWVTGSVSFTSVANKVKAFDWSDWINGFIDFSKVNLFNLGGGNTPANASGTNLFGGGLTWVGERGPELVSLPRGSQIYSNQDSVAMAGGGNVTIYATVKSDIDIQKLANRIRQELRRGS